DDVAGSQFGAAGNVGEQFPKDQSMPARERALRPTTRLALTPREPTCDKALANQCHRRRRHVFASAAEFGRNTRRVRQGRHTQSPAECRSVTTTPSATCSVTSSSTTPG